MSKSPVKIISVSPCANLDHFIKNYVSRNRQRSESSYLFKFANESRNKNQSSSRSGHKISLPDWRSLYGESRPRTQSFILNFNRLHRVDIDYEQPPKYKPFVSETKYKKLSKIQRDQSNSRTALDFYRSPMQNQIEIIGNLTARMGNTQNKPFRQRKVRKSSYLEIGQRHEKVIKIVN